MTATNCICRRMLDCSYRRSEFLSDSCMVKGSVRCSILFLGGVADNGQINTQPGPLVVYPAGLFMGLFSCFLFITARWGLRPDYYPAYRL